MAVYGLVVSRVPSHIPILAYEPSRWRKLVGLPGNCPKSVVQEFANQRSAVYLDENHADAYCIALAGIAECEAAVEKEAV